MTRRSPAWCMALLVGVLGVIFAPTTARADVADDLISRAITEYGLGRFDDSRKLLEEALTKASKAAQKARAQLYLGVNAAAQGDEKRAVGHFKAALVHDAALEVNASAVKPAVLALFRRVRANSTGRVAVTLQQPAAVVIVDGREVGPAPQILRLGAGKHRLTVRLRGGKTLYSRQIDVAAARTLRVEASTQSLSPRGAVALNVSPASARLLVDGKPVDAGKIELPVGQHNVTAWAPGHAQATRTIDVTRGATTRLSISLTPEARQAGGSGRRIWTWVAGASALVAIGIGAGFAVASDRDFSTYKDNCDDVRAADVRCLDLRRRIDNRDLAANALFGVGAGLAAAGVALWFIEGALLRKERDRSRAGARFSPLLGQVNGGSLSVTF